MFGVIWRFVSLSVCLLLGLVCSNLELWVWFGCDFGVLFWIGLIVVG